jgi:hypothetical protein
MQVSLPNIGNVNLDTLPDQCPLCHNNIHPVETGSAHYASGNRLERVFICPRHQCNRYFIARYQGITNAVAQVNYQLIESVPLTIVKSEQSDIIKGVSTDFVAIFGEAEVAEKSGLKLVCGPGYRRALEFLIKDYVIRSHPNDADAIKKLFLGKCISEYVTDEQVKKVAARAVWLGNDETHYVRKWEGKDLADLKVLIKLTAHWIEMDELTQKAMKDMPEG